MFKISKAVLKTLSSYHGISNVSIDSPRRIAVLVERYVHMIIKKSLYYAKKRTTLVLKRLDIDDVSNAIKVLFNREPLKIQGEISTELQKNINTRAVEDKWRRIMKPEPSDKISPLQLHKSPFHRLILDLTMSEGFNVQVGNSISILIQNEVEYYLFNLLRLCANVMLISKVATLSDKVISHVLEEQRILRKLV